MLTRRVPLAVAFAAIFTVATLWVFGPPPWRPNAQLWARAGLAVDVANRQIAVWLRQQPPPVAGMVALTTPVASPTAAVALVVRGVTPVPAAPSQRPTIARPTLQPASPTPTAPTQPPTATTVPATATSVPLPPTPVPPPPGGVYRVQVNDSLASIAARYGTTIDAILAANNMTRQQFVWLGQQLVIPGSGPATPGGAPVRPAGLTAMLALTATNGVVMGENLTPIPASSPAATRVAPRSPTATKVPGLPGKLVFQTRTGGDLYLIRADGTGLTRLAQGGEPSLSPDGQWVAFSRWGDNEGIYVIRTDGTDEKRVFGIHQPRQPAWSPDGSRIAFSFQQGSRDTVSRDSDGKRYSFTKYFWRIGVVNVDGTGFGELPSGSEQSFSPAWSPDSKSVIFAGDQGLILTAPDGLYREVSHGPWQQSPAWSPDGGRLAFIVKRGEHFDILLRKFASDLASEQPSLTNNKGIELWALTNQPMFADKPINSVSPAWSPDGQSIAFLTDRDGSWQIYVMKEDGSDQRKMFESVLDDIPLAYEFANEKSLDWGQ